MSFAFPRGDGASNETLKNPASDGAGKRKCVRERERERESSARFLSHSPLRANKYRNCKYLRERPFCRPRRIARAIAFEHVCAHARTFNFPPFPRLVATPRPILRVFRYDTGGSNIYKRNGRQCSSRKRSSEESASGF